LNAHLIVTRRQKSHGTSEFDFLRFQSLFFFRNLAIIRESSEYRMSFDGKTASLQISNFTSTKAGTYECVAKSEYGEIKSSTKVTFEKSGGFFGFVFLELRILY
jgi:hypothetical protein